MENLGLIVLFYFVFTFNIWIMTNGGVKVPHLPFRFFTGKKTSSEVITIKYNESIYQVYFSPLLNKTNKFIMLIERLSFS